MTSGERTWGYVLMGPDPLLAHCRRCGSQFARPALGMDLREFVRLLRSIEERHGGVACLL